MRIYTLEIADKELKKLPLVVRKRFLIYFEEIENNESLSVTEFKKLSGTELFEFRVKDQVGIFRAIAGKIHNKIYILAVFKKKSQKTPKNQLEKAKRRLSQIKNQIL